MQGTVIWFSNAKGYGFIRGDSATEDTFCHYTAIQAKGYKELKEGQKVEFEIDPEGPKGKPQAAKVKVIA
jgi:CspA family cold shock protein